MSLLSASFNGLDGATNDIQSFLKGDFVDGDELMFLDGSGYTRYFYRTVTVVDGKAGPAGWADVNYNRVSREIGAGESFWINSMSDKELLVAGAVSGVDQQIECSPGMNMLGVAFPVDVNLNDIVLTNVRDGDELMLHVPGSGYVRYFYRTVTVVDGTAGPAGWADANYNRVDAVIPKGAGFWISSTGENLMLTIKSPILKK